MLLALAGLGIVVGTIWIGEAVLDAVEAKRAEALQRAVGQSVEGAFREIESIPSPAGTGAAVDPPTGDSDRNPCDAYHDCCEGYLAALRHVEGNHHATIAATVQACEAIDRMRSESDADDTCRVMLDALRLGVEAWRGTPGFVPPRTCR